MTVLSELHFRTARSLTIIYLMDFKWNVLFHMELCHQTPGNGTILKITRSWKIRILYLVVKLAYPIPCHSEENTSTLFFSLPYTWFISKFNHTQLALKFSNNYAEGNTGTHKALRESGTKLCINSLIREKVTGWYYLNLIRFQIHVLEISVFLAWALLLWSQPFSRALPLIRGCTSVRFSPGHKDIKKWEKLHRSEQTGFAIPALSGLGSWKGKAVAAAVEWKNCHVGQ